jgi:hypothetical protein
VVLDLDSAPGNVCEAISDGGRRDCRHYPIATSDLASDEASVPSQESMPEAKCSKAEASLVRIIIADAPAGVVASAPALPSTDHFCFHNWPASSMAWTTSPRTFRGRVTLQALRQSGVAVPDIFVRTSNWPGHGASLRSHERP